MKEMTTAEFAKANLAALSEPVTVRRYTKTVGVYYPDGYTPKVEVSVPMFAPSDLDAQVVGQAARIVELEEEVKHLKKEIASRAVITPGYVPDLPPAVAGELPGRPHTMARPVRTDDPFQGLAKQDREFFERKLGKKK